MVICDVQHINSRPKPGDDQQYLVSEAALDLLAILEPGDLDRKSAVERDVEPEIRHEIRERPLGYRRLFF